MLSKLTIKNVALIESADIIFGEGFNVLSGETGAGKSVILDSVNFVLGAKADRTMIRYGETECMVKAEFIVDENARAVQILRDMDIDSDGEIIISRKYSETGKNTIKINGNTVTATMLRQVTDFLVDVHGQSEHFFLLQEGNQLKTLDNVVGNGLIPLKTRLNELLTDNKRIDQQIGMLGGNEQERNRRLDLLKFQIEEISSVGLQEGEEEALIEKRNKIVNVEKIILALKDAMATLSSEDGVLDRLRGTSRALSVISNLDDNYLNVYEKIESIAIETEDVAETLTDFGEELYFDENEAQETENRLDCIRALKRKYGADKRQIDEYFDKIQEEFNLLSDCEGQYLSLMKKKEENVDEILKICQDITLLRKTQGEQFCDRVTNELKTLNIPNAKFEISFNEYGREDAYRANSNGLDEICFLFSANAGEPLKPLGKIISGGEMSRFMLAIKTQLSNVNEISTYIFDEIDTGISGKTAKVVGEKLAKIAKTTQIIAVSHLAQIAALSDNEFLIEKKEVGNKTLTHVYSLDDTGKIQELVRLLGGNEGDEFALKHANELIKQAKEYKKTIS